MNHDGMSHLNPGIFGYPPALVNGAARVTPFGRPTLAPYFEKLWNLRKSL